MAKIWEWEEYFKSLSKDDLIKIYNAIDILESYYKIREEYKWTGLFVLKTIIDKALREKYGVVR